MATKTITTKTGKTITAELVREVKDKTSYADGHNIVTGREIVEYINITFRDQSGKFITQGKGIEPLHGRNKAQMQAQGAVARIGDAAVTQEIVDLVSAALAELEAENPKTAEQIEIESGKAVAKADHDAWYNSDEQRAARKFAREMNRADSDC